MLKKIIRAYVLFKLITFSFFVTSPASGNGFSALIIDMNHEGLQFSDADNPMIVKTSLGEKGLLSWPASQSTQFLVFDANKNNRYDGMQELVGSESNFADPDAREDGFFVLGQLDQNGDDIVDINDPAFRHLKIWSDMNADGVSQKEEIKPLASVGISGINYNARKMQLNDDVGNTSDLRATVEFTNGRKRFIYNVRQKNFAPSKEQKPAIDLAQSQ